MPKGSQVVTPEPLWVWEIKVMPSHFLLRENEAATYLNVTQKTLARWRREGRGPTALKLSSSIRYHVDQLDAFIANSEIKI